MTPKNRDQFSEHGSAAGLRCGTDLRKNQRIMRKIAAIAAAADEEGAAGGSPQPLADMIEFSQQLMILRGRHRSISSGPLGGPIKLRDLRAQVTRLVRLDPVGLHRGPYTCPRSLSGLSKLPHAGWRSASKRNGDEKCDERCSPEDLGSERAHVASPFTGEAAIGGHLPAVGRRFRRARWTLPPPAVLGPVT